MSNIEHQTQSHIQILNVEYEYQTKPNIQIECRISNIKLNPTLKSNVKYRISNSIQLSNRMSNVEYQTQSNIKIE